jgi:hypothetical protein
MCRLEDAEFMAAGRHVWVVIADWPSGEKLAGYIKWSSRWHSFCFEATPDYTVLNDVELTQIAELCRDKNTSYFQARIQ